MGLFAGLGFVFVYDVAIADDTASALNSNALLMAAGDVASNTSLRWNSACVTCPWCTYNSILRPRYQPFSKHSPACTICSPEHGHLVDSYGELGVLVHNDAGILTGFNEALGSFFACDEAPEGDFKVQRLDTDGLGTTCCTWDRDDTWQPADVRLRHVQFAAAASQHALGQSASHAGDDAGCACEMQPSHN